MSRNLCRTNCMFCEGEVRLDEAPREVTRKDVGVHYDTYKGYGYAGMIAAHASCVDCCARYLAWIDQSRCDGYRLHNRTPDERGFFDLSFRSTFNDEPGDADLPLYEIEVRRVRVGPWKGRDDRVPSVSLDICVNARAAAIREITDLMRLKATTLRKAPVGDGLGILATCLDELADEYDTLAITKLNRDIQAGRFIEIDAIEGKAIADAYRECAELARKRADEEDRNVAYGALALLADELESLAKVQAP